ncbi:MAG: efflux transporter outer membrane subunit [Caulobacteraceae bacterium]|nr:efflux transporter outer membrane subunit [Caulobacteraceae bacterium]
MSRRSATALALVAAALSACAVGPDYKRPSVAQPTAFKEAQGWTPASPQDGVDRGDWWAVFNDPVLDALERKVEVSNQNLAAAEAAYRQAHELVAEDRAAYFPGVDLTAGTTKSHSASGTSASAAGAGGGRAGTRSSTTTIYQAQLGATWEPDVWGRIRRTVEGAKASAQASAADLANAKLSAQSELAADYLQLRLADAEKELLTATVQAYARSLEISQNKYAAGVAARSDVLQAQTILDAAKANLTDLDIARTQNEHAIAVLTGQAPADLTIDPIPGWSPQVPTTPEAAPSVLLQRRPDIASAERLVANANAQIGVQVAGYFPTIDLTASYGFESAALGSLFKASDALWSLGGSATQLVFDAGATHAKVAGARAAYDQAVATYRQTVLTAFQQVEDALSADRVLQNEQPQRLAASQEADQAEQILLNEYKAGTVDYTSVVTAEATALADRQTLLTLQVQRMTTQVTLIEALGGGWSMSQLPKG